MNIFLIEDDDLLDKYNTIWDKVSTDIKKNLIANLSIIKKLKTKIKSNGDEVADFYDKEIPKLDFNHTCSAIICFDSAPDKDGKYYPQVFLNALNKKELCILLMT